MVSQHRFFSESAILPLAELAIHSNEVCQEAICTGYFVGPGLYPRDDSAAVQGVSRQSAHPQSVNTGPLKAHVEVGRSGASFGHKLEGIVADAALEVGGGGDAAADARGGGAAGWLAAGG